MTTDAAALCLKSGNATDPARWLQAIESNTALAALVAEGLPSAGLPAEAVQVVEITDRAAVGRLVTMTEYVDVIAPRGGKSLIARLMEEARAPMIKHLDGICHVYIDTDADLDKAMPRGRQRQDAALRRRATRWKRCWCRATSPPPCSPPLASIYQEKGVELRVCAATRATLQAAGFSGLVDATEEDWRLEYLAPVLAIRTVDGLDAAIDHINTYGSAHTDSIITENYTAGMRFLREVDSASVMINASTRFADGFEYGLGAEIGISNDKLHARGPVGLEGLTSLKYVVLGHGEIRT